jgi:hypothetical protein
MNTVIIPRADWRAALDELSTSHDGWHVSLEVLGPEFGVQPEIDDLPLRGVTAEVGEAESTITIAAGSGDTDQVTHVIHQPSRVQLEQNDAGADVALEIESSDREKAILRFLSPAQPQAVNPIFSRTL